MAEAYAQPGGTYTIQSGDTLSGIAAQTGISVEDLAELNGIENPDRIQAGIDLYIPSGEESGHPGGAVAVEGAAPVAPHARSDTSDPGVSADPAEPAEANGPTVAPEDAVLGPPSNPQGAAGLQAGLQTGLGDFAGPTALGVLTGIQSLITADQSNDDLGMMAGGIDLLSEFDGSESSALDGFAGNVGDLAGLGSDNEWDRLSSGFDLAADFGSSGSLGQAAGVVGGLGTLANLDDAFAEGDFGGIAQGASVLASAVGAQALSSTIDGFVPYAGMFTSLAAGDAMGAAISAVSMALPAVGVGIAIAGALGVFDSEPPPPPEAEAMLAVDEQGRFFVESATDRHGGNAGAMSVAAQRAADTINHLIDATGGRVLDPSDLRGIEIGYDGDGVYAGERHFGSVSDAIAHIVETRLENTAIEGGDVYAKRALYHQLETGFDPADLQQALETARDYSRYQDRSAEIEHLAADEAVADALAGYRSGELSRNALGTAAALVLDARETAAAAGSLGLDQPHRFDQASRLNEAFEQAGIDLDGVEITDLVLSNLHGELVVAIRDPKDPEASIRDLPHAGVDAHAPDFDAAMLYLPDGEGGGGQWNLEALLNLAGVEPGAGAVGIEQALIDRYADAGEAVRMGSAGDDTVDDTAAGEALIGWQGSDTLRAGSGDDTLIGGAGADTLAGGEGEDTADYSASAAGVAVDLEAGSGRGGDAEGDTLEDIEHLEGSGHDDRLAGDGSDNELTGHAGDDTLIGRGGADSLHGGAGDDRLDGGQGDDRLSAGAGEDSLLGAAGDDRLGGGEGDDRLSGGAGDDFIMAGSGDDLVSGGSGRDTVHAGAGDDTLLGAGDGDTLIGGAGTDTVAYEHDLADYRVDRVDGELRIGLRPDLSSGLPSAGPGDRLIDIETVQFGDRTVSVESLREYLSILDQADEEERERRISGVAKSGATAIGDAAAIGLVAGFAAPAIAAEQRRAQQAAEDPGPAETGDRQDPYTPPGAAADDRLADRAPDANSADFNADSPVVGGGGGGGSGGGIPPGGGPGADGFPAATTPGPAAIADRVVPDGLIEAGEPDQPAVVDAPSTVGDSLAGTSGSTDEADSLLEPIDREEGAYYLVGTPGADELIDERHLDRIFGLGGDDLILALDGDDRIFGDAGDDVILPGTGDNEIDGGAGFDTVSYRDAGAGVGVDLRAGIGTGGMAAGDTYAGIEAVEGSQYADSLIAPDLSTSALYGLGGDDNLVGGRGNDTLVGGRGSDAFVAGAGDDTLMVDATDDLGFVDGGSGSDTVRFVEAPGRTVDLNRLDGVETVVGSAGDDTWIGDWGLTHIVGGDGHDVTELADDIHDIVTFDPSTGEIGGLEWRTGGAALQLTRGDGAAVTIETEEIHFDGHAVYLDGRDNAPITSGETLTGKEDEPLDINESDLIANDFDIDPGDAIELLGVGGIDLALTRGLTDSYWDESIVPESIEPASGEFRTDRYGSYRTGSPKESNPDRVDYGPRPGDRYDGTDGDDVLHGQILTEYSGTDYLGGGPSTRTFHDSDRLFGHGGDDLFVTGKGGDLVVGGAGNDTVDYSRSGGYVEVDLLGNSGSHGRASGDELLGIENVIGSDNDDRLSGDAADNILQGGSGDDVLEGRGGDDVLIGGDGRWDAAVFSGDREDYEITANDDHLVVEHLGNGVDGTDKLYGIQELRFADRNVRIRDARVDHGEVRVTDHGIQFDPDRDFNSLDGDRASFGYEVGQVDGARAAETASVDIAPVNDLPYLAPGEVDYDGTLVRGTYKSGSGQFSPKENNTGVNTNVYWTVEDSGSILGRDLEDGADLTYELVDGPDYGRVELAPDGNFTYRLNVGEDAPVVTHNVYTVCQPRGGCTTYERYNVVEGPEDPGAIGQFRDISFDVRITDSGEGESDPESVVKKVTIENDKPRDGDACFPVAMDLGDDGLDFRGVDDSGLLADVNGDGLVDRMAWIGADDGLLMLDRDGDGAASDPDEISFVDDHPDARTDMEGLALAFDTNTDGVLDSADERWSEFRVWQDADGDGVSDPGELRTLGEAGITSIGVIADGLQESAAGGDVTIFGRSEFTRADGSTGTAGDVALRYESATTPTPDMLQSQSITAGDANPGPAAAPPASPTNDELAAMMVQRIVQADSVQGGEQPIDDGGSVPIDDAALADAMSESDEFDVSTVAG